MKRNLRSVIPISKLCLYLVCLLFTCALCLYTTGFASAEPLDPDLVLYFDYEEFKGDTVVEKSGRGYDGAISGKVTQSDDGKGGGEGEGGEEREFVCRCLTVFEWSAL